jgi:hypothetical protein
MAPSKGRSLPGEQTTNLAHTFEARAGNEAVTVRRSIENVVGAALVGKAHHLGKALSGFYVPWSGLLCQLPGSYR